MTSFCCNLRNRAGLHMSAEKAGSSGSEAETKCVYMFGLDGTG